MAMQVEDPQLMQPFLEREDADKGSKSLTPNPPRRSKSANEEEKTENVPLNGRSNNQFHKLHKMLTLIDKNMTVVS